MMPGAFFILCGVVIVISIAANVWLRRYRRRTLHLMPLPSERIRRAGGDPPVTDDMNGVDGDVIARINRYQQEYDAARTRWLEDGEQR